MAFGASSCNEKSDEPDENLATSSVAVNAFTLEANSKVLARLDSVFFSIDLEHGVIFNADSLPKGTDVRALVAKITYPGSVTSATIEMQGGEHREGSFSYSQTPTDTIDFTGRVTLKLQGADGLEKSYRLKVNVHKMTPDSLMWDKIAVSTLPSRNPAPEAQKTVAWKSGILSLIRESDGSYTRAFGDATSKGWRKEAVDPGFAVNLPTLTVCGDKLYALSDAGELMESSDAETWTSTGALWDNIVGAFGDTLLGLRSNNGNIMHTAYPLSGDFSESQIEEGFPVAEYSNMGTFSSAWSPDPTAFIIGGRDKEGNAVSATWAYDGANWAMISNRPMPARLGATMLPYFAYRASASGIWTQTRYSVWLAMGGRDAGGKPSADLYISYDSGVNWEKAPQLLQLPDYIPALYAADAIVMDSQMSANLSEAWTRMASPRLRGANASYTIDGDKIDWECPYIYLFGGYGADGRINDRVFRGVLARLTFRPVI